MSKLLILIFSFLSLLPNSAIAEDKLVLLAILARNSSHTLPSYLRCIENLDYDKKLITIYINTNNNCDNTEELLKEWTAGNQAHYREIIVETHEISDLPTTKPHEWTPERFKILAQIRQKSLEKTLEFNCDYYFCIDCDNFIAPHTLRALISKDKPIIAPMLRGLPRYMEPFCNYFGAIDEGGYYTNCPQYYKILDCSLVGTFQVPVIHQTYLVKAEHINNLSYLAESTDHEFVIFSRSARAHDIDQYICNESEFGTFVHLPETLTLEEESEAFQEMIHSHTTKDLSDHSGFGLTLGKIKPSDDQYPVLSSLASLLEKQAPKTIVSIGSPPGGDISRNRTMDPNLMLAHLACRNRGHFYSVNIHEPSLKRLAQMVAPFRERASFVNDESIHFLNKFFGKIDCLYLNYPKNEDHLYLEAINEVYNKLSEQCVIMIGDLILIRSLKKQKSKIDCDEPTIRYLLERSWHIVDYNEHPSTDLS